MMEPAVLKRSRKIQAALAALILLTIVIGIGTGYSSLSYDRLLPTLLGQGSFKEEFVLFSVRIPRMLITLLAGMALALSGAILQGVTRNDLADPGIIGIQSGAGAAIAVFYLFVPIDQGVYVYLLPFVGFVGALLTASLIYLSAHSKAAGLLPVRLVLTGVGFSMALSGLMIVLVSSAERDKAEFVARWLAGNIWGTDWPFVAALLPWLLILIPFSLYKAQRLNLLALSEPVVIGLGVAIHKERRHLLLAAVALAASAVSVTGGIAFIGLMAPHMAKSLVGPRHQLCMPVAILLGGWLLLLADTIGRNAVDTGGLPAGIIVALIGAPYFLYLLSRR